MHCTRESAIIDTELKGIVVAKKFGDNVIVKKVEDFDTLRKLVQQACLSPDIKTIVWDSSTDVKSLAENEWHDETKKDKVFPLFVSSSIS